MYGMVNKAIEEMVIKHHGEPVWEAIRTRAGVDIEVFMTNESYSDDVTYNLVQAASEVLDLPADDILHAFGEHWILFTAQEGYGGLIRAAGKTLAEFLQNLPLFHARVSMIYPKLRPPTFEYSDFTDTSVRLHYYSDRPGLQQFVIGLMHGLGKMYSTPVHVERVVSKGEDSDHDIFVVNWRR